MSDKTAIQWADKTWNPCQGCRKVSEGCANCYMFRDKKRFGQDPSKIIRSSQQTFNRPLKWKEPAKVFTCSWSDFFIEEADPWRPEAWEIIRKTPYLTYQILTKRPERVQNCLPDFWPELKNVWLGVTVEKQKYLDRIVPLAQVKPTVLFISVEPMLEAISILHGVQGILHNDIIDSAHRVIDWVICGGESGPGYREMEWWWAANLKNQCEIAKIPFFMKQVSGVTKKQCAQIPDDLMARAFPI